MKHLSLFSLLGILSLSATSFLSADNFFVTNLNDDGEGSLRQALELAVTDGDIIDFEPRLEGTISLESPLPLINNALTINGPSSQEVTINGNDKFQIFFANKGRSSISNLNLEHGSSQGGKGEERLQVVEEEA